MWQLMKIQRVMKMMKIELEILACHPKKWVSEGQKSFQKVNSVRKTHSEVTSNSARKIKTKFQFHKFSHF